MKRYSRVQLDEGPAWVHWDRDESGVTCAAPWLDGGGPVAGAGRRVTRAEARYLPPCSERALFGLGYNYKPPVMPEGGYDEPLLFLKGPGSGLGAGRTLSLPALATKVWVEVELAIVVGRACKDVSPEEAAGAILGHAISSDVSAENVHGRDVHLARSKAADCFAPLGPDLVVGADVRDAACGTRINGTVRQDGRTGGRVLTDAEAVSLVSRFFALQPGDVIMTGTPVPATECVVSPGDAIEHWIDGLGTLRFDIG